MRKVMTYIAAGLLSLMVLISNTACLKEKEDSEASFKQVDIEKPEKLRVYLNGIPASSDGYDGESYEYHTSGYTFGLYQTNADIDAVDGHSIYQALLEYGKQNQIEFDFVWYQSSEELEYYLEEDKKQNYMPNLVLSGRPCLDIEQWMRTEELGDFSALIQEDETFNDEMYYQKIVQAGSVGERQYILPYLFNVNSFITAEDTLDKLSYHLPEDFTYEEALELFGRSCEFCADEPYVEALTQRTGGMGDYYLPVILGSAARPSVIDREREKVMVTEKEFIKLVELMQLFYMQEFGISLPVDAAEWDAKREENPWFKDKVYLDAAEQVAHQMIFLDGGNSWGVNQYSSLLGNAIYMNSYYKDENRTMILRAIPMIDESAYAANITGFGFCFKDEPYIETIYDILKYLMNYEFKIPFGFSVSRTVTEKQLEMAETTNYAYMPDGTYMHAWSAEEAEMLAQWKENWTEELSPLDKKYCDQIREILNQIGVAALPGDPAAKEFCRQILMAAIGRESAKAAYEDFVVNMTEYMEKS